MPADYDRQQRELLDAVWDDYENDAPRAAYADWLDSIGDPADSARAQFIRLRLRSPASDWRNPQAVADWRAGEELFRKYRSAWLAGLPAEFDARWVASNRGMFEITAYRTPQEWQAEGDRWFRRSPPDVAFHIHLRSVGGRKGATPIDWAALFAKPWWDRVLTFGSGGSRQLGGAEVAGVGAHPGFRRLRSLNLAGSPIGDAGAAVLAAAPHLGSLRTLDLSNCGLSASGAAALAGRSNMRRLKSLHLVGNPAAEQPDEAVVAAAKAAGGRVTHTERQFGVYYDGTTPQPDYGDDDIPF